VCVCPFNCCDIAATLGSLRIAWAMEMDPYSWCETIKVGDGEYGSGVHVGELLQRDVNNVI
jgi:hypothetical protein